MKLEEKIERTTFDYHKEKIRYEEELLLAKREMGENS